MKFIDVFITCPDRACAEAIAKACVEERLAACANIGGAITSIYRWKGVLETTEEAPLYLKTRATLFDRLATRIRTIHPYEVCCIVAFDLADVDADYAAWLEAETLE